MELNSSYVKWAIIKWLIDKGLQGYDDKIVLEESECINRIRILDTIRFRDAIGKLIVRSKDLYSKARELNLYNVINLYEGSIYPLINDLNYNLIKSSECLFAYNYPDEMLFKKAIENSNENDRKKIIELRDLIFNPNYDLDDTFTPLNGLEFTRRDFIVMFTTIDDRFFNRLEAEWPQTSRVIETIISIGENLIEEEMKNKGELNYGENGESKV